MSHSPSPDISSSRHPDWLAQQGLSLAFTTYQTNRLLLLGLNPNGLSGVLRAFEPRGLVVSQTRHFEQVWHSQRAIQAALERQGLSEH